MQQTFTKKFDQGYKKQNSGGPRVQNIFQVENVNFPTGPLNVIRLDNLTMFAAKVIPLQKPELREKIKEFSGKND